MDEEYSCYCGKVCKGLRGLQAHKRSCRILDLSHEENAEEPVEVIPDELREYHEKLSGIKLPTTRAEWDRVLGILANEHFRITFYDENIDVLSGYVKNVQSSVYNYFRDNYGTVSKENSRNNFCHYNDMSNRKLKAALRNLKNISSGYAEIRYVARLLRSRMNKDRVLNKDTEYDHEYRFKHDFWKYCKTTFEPNERTKPTTSEEDCYKYFCDKLRLKNTRKQFKVPKWMKTRLDSPRNDFDLSPRVG